MVCDRMSEGMCKTLASVLPFPEMFKASFCLFRELLKPLSVKTVAADSPEKKNIIETKITNSELFPIYLSESQSW